MMSTPKGHDMSQHWRLVSVDGGPVTGTFWVSKPDHRRQIVKAIDVSVWFDDHTWGRHFTDMTALIKAGEVDILDRTIDERVRADVLTQLDALKAAVLAAATAVTWPQDGAEVVCS